MELMEAVLKRRSIRRYTGERVAEADLLAAVDRGLGSVWCGVYPKEALVDGVRALLGLPSSVVPIGLVVLGHPDEDRAVDERFDLAKVHRHRW